MAPVAALWEAPKNPQGLHWDWVDARYGLLSPKSPVQSAISVANTMRTRLISLCKAALQTPMVLPIYAMRRAVARSLASRKITRVDNRNIPSNREEIRAFMVVRNESLRLPFMLNHYLSNGVDRIFILDNGSSDETPAIALSHQNTHVFNVHDDYAHQAAWLDLLLRRYGTGCWCLVVDADEILIYPDFERIPLRSFCNSLDLGLFDALDCVLLDMYPDGRLNEIEYKRGTDPLLVAPWFDGSSYGDGRSVSYYVHRMNIFYRGPSRLMGGMRKRVFNVDACISKFPLVKFNKTMYLSPGAHFVQNGRIGDLRGALLHFKYLNDFARNVASEVSRAQRAHGNESEYKQYLTFLNDHPDISWLCPNSTRFSGSSQLVELGIMKRSSRI